MNITELKEKYGHGKLLNELKNSDFNKFNKIEETIYKGVQVRVEKDILNNRWLYSSDEVCLSGVSYGTLAEVKTYIKSGINEIKEKNK